MRLRRQRIKITEAKATLLRVGPQDTLVVSVDRELTAQQAERLKLGIREATRLHASSSVVIIHGKDIRLAVVGPTPLP